jgi:hypothetical protein
MKKRIYYPTKWIKGKQYRIHRLVMEKYLKRKLTSQELVHHIDGNPNNNDIKNLEITTRAKHAKTHKNYIKTQFKQKYFISKEKLTDLYVNQRISLRQISFKLKLPQSFLLRMKNKYGLKQQQINCEVCGNKARYIKAKRCNKCYQREFHRLYRKNHK